MTQILKIARLLWASERPALWRALALSMAVLAAGIALLGLSGWFILAAGMAGLAGAGQVFDVFRPSAAVRFLALGRTLSRYGERILSHDATLRGLARLRLQILRHLTRARFAQMARLRSAEALNRLTWDIDALDGLIIRLILPVLAGAGVLTASFAALWLLVHPWVAALVVGGMLALTGMIFVLLARGTFGPALRADQRMQQLRTGVVDHLRGRDVLASANQLEPQGARLRSTCQQLMQEQRQIARAEHLAGAGLHLSNAILTAGALVLGGGLALGGAISPSLAALGVFATLAMAEVAAPLRRGLAEIGRIRAAAGRLSDYVAPVVDPVVEPGAPLAPLTPDPSRQTDDDPLSQPALSVKKLGVGLSQSLLAAPLSFAVGQGETVALVGPSGSGKSTVLNTIAGLIPPLSGDVALGVAQTEKETQAKTQVRIGYLTQRPALIRGTLRDAVLMGATATDAELQQVLTHLDLWQALAPRGGLDMPLGEGGAGLSGGQRKRLALARVLIRRPEVLLLDELTEGLDAPTADKVLRGVRLCLPQAAILLAAHRPQELEFADRRVAVG